jgi:hypothetical protein
VNSKFTVPTIVFKIDSIYFFQVPTNESNRSCRPLSQLCCYGTKPFESLALIEF